MADRTSSWESGVRSQSAGIDEQLWPIVCATIVLVGILGVIVIVNSDFDEDRLILNGYTQLAGLAAAAALLIFVASRLKGAARRTAELAILLSLAWHATLGVGAFYLFSNSVGGANQLGDPRSNSAEGDDSPVPDYHWAQDDEQPAEQAFEKVVETPIREQSAPAAVLQPRNMDRPAAAAEIPHAANAEISPLGVGETPETSGPLDIRHPVAAKVEEAKPLEALAMARQMGDPMPLPKTEAPAPAALPAAPAETPKTPEPTPVQAEKADKVDWTKVAKLAATPNNGPLPPPHKLTRVEVQPGDPLPSASIVARLPSQTPQNSKTPSGQEAASEITQPSKTIERSKGDGVPQPSAVIADAGALAQAPNAGGGQPASRLESVVTAPVQKSDMSHAPLGPTISSSGVQDSSNGSSLFPSRRGAIYGGGKALPSVAGDSTDEAGEVRAGSPDSNLLRGLAQPSAAARRAIASQLEDGGSSLIAGQGGGLPRTQSELIAHLPAAAKIAESAAFSGGGGTSSHPGGIASSLDVGQRIALQHTAGSGVPRGNSRNSGGAAWGEGDSLPGNDVIARGGVVGTLGGGVHGPHDREGTVGGTDAGSGAIPRARSEAVDLRPGAIAVGPVAGTADATHGPVAGGNAQGSGGAVVGSAAVGPNERLGGIGRRESVGQGFGTHPSVQVDPSEIASIGVTSPQPTGVGGRGGRGDGQLDQFLSGGGSGPGGIGRGNSPVVVSGQVHEPMASFRRGARGGLTIGDPSAGQLTEPAIENGLEYFAHTQFGDGHWSLHALPEGVAADAGTLGSLHADTAATGMALLAYLGAGYTHEDDKYRDVVRRGVEWLVKHQQADGNLSYQGSEPTHYYSQGIATMALCEAYGMTQDRELREPAQKAVDFILKSQDPDRGGWRYRPRDGSDTSVTGWQLMALKSAQMAGLEVSEEALRKIGHWLDFAQVPDRGTYVYNPLNTDNENPQGRAPNPTMTAQAMIMRMYLSQDRDRASLTKGADYLLGHLPDVGTREIPQRDCYYWYYATQAMYHMQGDYWKTWQARITPLLRAGQIERGPLKGSWSPAEPVPDRWSAHGGRHYVTSLHVLTLEFPYWHLPLFRELRKE
jgi:hypothetical protein